LFAVVLSFEIHPFLSIRLLRHETTSPCYTTVTQLLLVDLYDFIASKI
jgi:hypothetical protein